jgi:hypothetical protein
MLNNIKDQVASFMAQHRILFRVLMIFMAGTVGICIGAYSPVVESGTVEYKLITGQDANKHNVVLLDMGDEIIHTDHELECFFSPTCRNLTVEGCLAEKINEDYTGVEYLQRSKRSLQYASRRQSCSVPGRKAPRSKDQKARRRRRAQKHHDQKRLSCTG